jgi:ribosomal protein L29
MDSILSDEPSVQNLPESDSPSSETVEPAPEKQDAKPTASPQTAPEKAPTKAVDSDDDDSSDKAEPGDLDGYKKALAAARGDKRRARKQWQEAEKKLAAFEGELRGLRQQSHQQVAPKNEPKPEDLEAEIYRDLPGYLKKQKEESRSEAQSAAAQVKLSLSESYARRSHPDFDEKKALFQAAAQRNPVFAQQAAAQPDPWEFAYQLASRIQIQQEIGDDPAAWREAQLTKLRAELEAERSGTATQTTPNPARPSPTRSIASSRGSGAGSTQAWSGHRSLDDILA